LELSRQKSLGKGGPTKASAMCSAGPFFQAAFSLHPSVKKRGRKGNEGGTVFERNLNGEGGKTEPSEGRKN